MTSPRADVIGGRLIVTSLRRDDGGVYTCTARNVVGDDYRVFRLVVEGESKLEQVLAYDAYCRSRGAYLKPNSITLAGSELVRS